MAQVSADSLLNGITGKLGKRLVFRRLRDGRTLVCTRPVFRDHKWTEDQQAHHSRFKAAAAYARAASTTIPLYAELAKSPVKKAYNLALSDWSHAPVIHEVTQLPDRIRVKATHNVQVAQVVVTVMDAQADTLDRGEAVHVAGAEWEYSTARALREGRVIAEPRYLAGNLAKYEL